MKTYMIIDGQWGSCGKGLIAGKLAIDRNPDAAVCNFGSNAGHTFIHNNIEIITRQIPIAAAINPNINTFIGAGAVIDAKILLNEIIKYKLNNIFIHPRAAIITEDNKNWELKNLGIGSTKKGVGQSLANKIARVNYAIARDCKELQSFVTSEKNYIEKLLTHSLVQIESAQGFELSLNHGYDYPCCTSRDITPESIMNDICLPYRFLNEIIIVYRTLPIRVGHDINELGQITGHSGKIYSDQQELTWKELSDKLGINVHELTTVTKKTRRIFSWSWNSFNKSLWHIHGSNIDCNIFINFLNYLTKEELAIFLPQLFYCANKYMCSVKYLGYGASYKDVKEYV